MPRVTYRLQEPNGRKFSIAGTGLTRAAAVAEANTKLALTVGTVIDSSVSDDLTVGETGLSAADATGYSDAELTLKQTATGKLVTIHLENIGNSFGDGITGDLDLTDDTLIDFATAYKDGSGAGGYEPYSGKFVA